MRVADIDRVEARLARVSAGLRRTAPTAAATPPPVAARPAPPGATGAPCRDCGREIEAARTTAVPGADRCLGCQRRHEGTG